MSKTSHPGDTRERVLRAASELFAARGFHATTIRDIAQRAGVNIAAGNYHFGSKKALYLAVLRDQFAHIRAVVARRAAMRPPAELARLPRHELVALLEARVRAMLELLIGPPPGLHGTLMMREMSDPSEALPVIVEELIRPLAGEMREIVARLEPRLDRRAVERSAFSIAGQAYFYRSMMPAALLLLGLTTYPRGFAAELAAHIAGLSLGGLSALAPARRRRRRAA